MSKGGGQGSFAQMQEPGLGMDMGGFGGGGPQPFTGYTPPQTQPIQMEEPVPLGIADNLNTGFIPHSPNNAFGGPGKTVIGGEGLIPQLQPISQPIASPQPQPRLGIGDPSNPMLQELRPLPQPGGFGAAMERFNNLSQRDRERLGDLRVGDIFGSGPQRVTDIRTQGPESLPRLEDQMRIDQVGETPRPQFIEYEASGPARPDPLNGVDLNRFSGGLGSKGGRSNPYQTDGIVPPVMRGQPLPGRRQFDPIDQPIPRVVNPPRTSRYTEADYSNAEAQAREILGLPPKSGGRVYAGGTPNFNEGTGEYRTGGIKPPRGPVKLEPIKMQPMPMPFEPVISDGPDFRPPPERMELPQPIPDYMLEDIESRGTVGPGGGARGRTGSFRDAIREFRDEFRYQPMPRRQPPTFGPPRNFPFPMPRPPRMPPRQPPRMPGRNTQFQMPFFGSPYGQMNPYAGQFSGYGVPSNMFSFAQPHYQPYVPPPPQSSAPPVMQLPPGQGGNQAFSGAPAAYTPPPSVSFGGGYGGIGGFGRYNLGLAGSQLR